MKTKGEDSECPTRLVIDSGKVRTFRKEARMSEQEERFEAEEEKDEVEAHKHPGKSMTDEPSSDDDSEDDFEAHRFKE